MQKPKNLLLVVPLGSPHFKADLPKVNSPAAKLFCLVFGDVVVEKRSRGAFNSRRDFSDNASPGKR
jgi:hypothetical protein